jgi:hypothetical protein
MFRWLRRLLHRERISDEVRARSRVDDTPLMLHKYSAYRGTMVVVPLPDDPALHTPLPGKETHSHD